VILREGRSVNVFRDGRRVNTYRDSRQVGGGTTSTTVPVGPTVSQVYLGARIQGSYQNTNRGATTANDAPTALADAHPNPYDTFVGRNSNTLPGAMGGKNLCGINWGGSFAAWPPTAFNQTLGNLVRTNGMFTEGGLSLSASALQDVLAVTASPGSTAANRALSYLGTYFTGIKTFSYPIIWRPLWEMNGTWYPWGRPGGSGGSVISDADYIQIWQNLWHICADVMAGVTIGSFTGTSTGNISFWWCANWWQQSAGVSAAPRFPGEAYLDWVGCDAYVTGPNYETPEAWMDWTYNQLRSLAPNKPIYIGEWGVNEALTGGTKAGFFSDMLTRWLPLRPWLKGLSYYEYDADFPNNHIETSENSRAAFAAAVQSPRFLSAPAASHTAGSKLPIPAMIPA
jgi:hypothetical protein